MKKLYAFICIVLVTTSLFSQNTGITSYVTTVPGITVSSSNINKRSALAIDNNGNKWVGFNYGNVNSFQLIRFNGTQWDTFPAFNAILATNKVNALAVDASNNIWIGHNAGLTKYDGTSFTTYNTSNSSIASNTVSAIGYGNGNVYVGTSQGFSVFNGSSFTNYNTSNGLNSNTINCIAVENANTIWLGNPSGLDKFDGNNFSFSFILPSNGTDAVNCIYIDVQNNKWLGTDAHGAIKYDNSSFNTMQQLYPNTQDLLGAGNWPTTVKCICKGPNGGVLLSVGTQSINGKTIGGYSFEITTTQLFAYSSLGIGYTASNNKYSLMQHDVGSNKIFYFTYGAGGISSAPFLYSFDVNQFSDPLGVSNTNSAFLDINNVNALITDNSSQHWDSRSSMPKYFDNKQNNTSPLFASSMWIGAYVGAAVHMAAMTYRQNGYDFWPGPINPATDSIDNATMNAYNKVWKVNRFDIANFIYAWNAGNVQNHTFVPAAAIINWPGNSPYTGQMLAPYIDYNNDGSYNYMDGDYPLIKGDQMIWSVFNDVYGNHTESNSIKAMGLEIQASAYAFTCPNSVDSNVVLNNSTFYNYKIFNRGANRLDSTYISLWMDSDLGNYQDDYVGCDVMNDFGYTYNGDNYDEDALFPGYHTNLPVFACNVLGGPLADANDGIDNNHNCLVDEPGERCMMSGFTYYNNTGSTLNGNPNGYNAYYNLMASKWEQGSPMTYGATGLTAGNTPCKYLFPGNSDPLGYGLGYKPFSSGTNCSPATPVVPPGSYGTTGWTEGQAGNQPGDRRFMVNIGKFTMQPGDMRELDYALVFSQDSANCNANNTCVINRAVADNQRVKRWFKANSYPSCLSLAGVGIKQNASPQLNLSLYPNPANTNLYVEFAAAQKNVTIEVFDMLGNLVQGFQYNELGKYAVLPVSTLQNGVYLVKIQSADGFVNRKFIKE